MSFNDYVDEVFYLNCEILSTENDWKHNIVKYKCVNNHVYTMKKTTLKRKIRDVVNNDRR